MGLTRRELTRLLLLAPLMPALGCKREARLSLYNWVDYLAREVVDTFIAKEEATTRIRPLVTEDTFLSEYDLVEKLRAGGSYDVVFPTDYVLSRMHKEGLLAPLDRAKLVGLENLDLEFAPWEARAERGGGTFAIPYLWGTTGIGYDSRRIDPPPTSWNALFDPQYQGRISVIDSKGDVMDQALLAAGMNINSNDKQRIRDEIWPRLQQQKPLLRGYDSSPAKALISGETWIAQIDSGDLLQARLQRSSLRYVIPEEGAVLWVDYVAIPSKAADASLAHRFIEHLLDPAIAAINANVLRYGTPNRVALERGLIHQTSDPNIYPPAEMRAKLTVSEDWDGKTGSLVDQIWADLKGVPPGS